MLLKVENLAVQFGGIRAVDNVSFHVKEGEVFTIIGPNGAGKTTIFNLISRIYESTAGVIIFEGKDIAKCPAHQVANMGIARTFQNIELFENATVLDNLLLGRHPHRGRQGIFGEMLFLPTVRQREFRHRKRVEEIIDFLELAHYRGTPISALPYGVRKVVELGRGLTSEPRLLLLDEPSSGLNVEETEDMSFWIKDIRDELGVTVCMVEHDMTLVNRVSDRVLALNYGRVIAEGTPAEIQHDTEVVQAYLGA